MRCFLGAVALVALMVLPLALSPARADTIYQQTDLVSDIQGLGMITDPNLVNPWGISFSSSSPFWVSDAGKNISTLYSVTSGGVSKVGLEVPIPTTVSGPQGPTGQVANPTSDFLLPDNAKANFIFANLNGTISAWHGGLAQAVVVATTTGANYTGLALGSNASGNLLYAANNAGAGKIDVFNGSFAPVNLGSTAFATPAAVQAAGLVPFNVQTIPGNGNIYVTYAPAGHAAQTAAAEGQGAVAVFDSSGKLIGPVIAGGKLASPWGVALAPASFGSFGGDLLVGNFAYGFSEINAFDPVTGALLGTLLDAQGKPIENQALWALDFGNGGMGGDPNTLYFAAGIMGETHGLFGAISPAQAPVPEPGALALLVAGGLALYGARRWRRRTA